MKYVLRTVFLMSHSPFVLGAKYKEFPVRNSIFSPLSVVNEPSPSMI